MSAIFGLFHRNSDPLDPNHLPLMRDSLMHRGPDGLSMWQNGSIGLGHALLTTTPESAPIPYCTDHLVVTCDSRIDNRTPLCDALSLPPTAADPALIAAAYLRWGDDFAAHLDGAYAIALWDESRRTLICARDHLGLKPFYHYASSQIFAFATEIKALLALPLIPRRINEVRLADFLILDVSDTRQTFYEGVRRLSAAHRLRVTSTDLHESAYWSLEVNPRPAQESDTDIIAHFRTLFLNALEANMRTDQRIGSLFSGGMDSSAITAAAPRYLPDHQHTLPTFTAIAPSVPRLDESEYVNAVLAKGGYDPHYFRSDEVGPFFDQARMLHHMEEPFMVGSLYMMWGTGILAQQHGIRVMLVGNAGDEVVGHGMGYLAELAYTQQWDRFDHEASALRASYFSIIERDPLVSYYKYGFPVITRLARERRPFATLKAVTQLSKRTGIPPQRLIKKYLIRPLRQALRPNAEASALPGIPVNPDFARRIDLHTRYQLLNQQAHPHPISQWDDQYTALNLGMVPVSFEVIDRVGGAFGIDMRQPFADRALLEYSLTIPGHLKLRNGLTRWILREALRDVLPEPNYHRPSKSEMSAGLYHSLIHFESQWLADAFRHPDAPIARYVDVTRARVLLDSMLTQPTSASISSITRLMSLERWLEHNS